jgi:hypothetical protein
MDDHVGGKAMEMPMRRWVRIQRYAFTTCYVFNNSTRPLGNNGGRAPHEGEAAWTL